MRRKPAPTGRNATVTLWGHGTARREFLHVDDAAERCDHDDGVGCDRALQRRLRFRSDHQGARGDRRAGRRIRRTGGMGYVEARRNTAQADGFVAICESRDGRRGSRSRTAFARRTTGIVARSMPRGSMCVDVGEPSSRRPPDRDLTSTRLSRQPISRRSASSTCCFATA